MKNASNGQMEVDVDSGGEELQKKGRFNEVEVGGSALCTTASVPSYPSLGSIHSFCGSSYILHIHPNPNCSSFFLNPLSRMCFPSSHARLSLRVDHTSRRVFDRHAYQLPRCLSVSHG